ncbi:hypothetical protein SPI_03387 [Niveomyces insectorum RCEF 264]|uniref:Uncharacterized protein n=1 Tax=Niveomyces insectorum RCEF 264 TaxID=1081102 RepID=A0A162MNZ2_9HYPO|nr:hypothetical protein SPI_03387 [Niveomyces insectorum RCEF 264]
MGSLRVGELQVFRPQDGTHDYEEFPVGDPMHWTVHDIVDASLYILETSEGRRVLGDLATLIVKARQRAGQMCLYPPEDDFDDDMDRHIRAFLRKLRTSFPEVYIMKNAVEATTVREKGPFGPTLGEVQPYQVAKMKLCAMAMYDILRTQSEGDRKKYMFHMIVAVTHELCHVLTGYLIGEGRPRTPGTVEIEGMSREAGFYLEMKLFGGILDCFAALPARDGDPLDPHQPGVSYFFENATDTAKGRPISGRFIEDFVNSRGAMGLHIQVDMRMPERSRGGRRRETASMNRFRLDAMNAIDTARRATVTRPGEATLGSSSSTFRYRMLPQEADYYGSHWR